MSITASNLSLFSNSGTSNSLSNLFSIIGGQYSSASTDPVAALISAEKNSTKEIARQQKDPETQQDIKRFLSAVAKAPDLKTLMQDPSARKVLLTANGLGDQSDYVALATKALSSDTSKSGSFASKLSNAAWLAAAKTYDFANKGLTVLKDPATLATITKGYAQVVWQKSLDNTTPGLSAALDFRSRANTIKNVDQILGDANLRKVVTGALGLPLEIALQPLEAQEKAITTRVDITKFSDPKFVEQFTRRFLIANQASNSNSSSTYA